MIEGPGDEQSSPESDADGITRTGLSTDDGSAARGWVVPPGGSRVDALFLVSTERLGIGRSESNDPPIWFDLTRVVKLDAIGEPDGGLLHVELVMDDDTVVSAGWPVPFCNKVVEALSATRSSTEPADPEVSELGVESDIELDVPETAVPETAAPESAFSVKPVVRRRSRNRRNGGDGPETPPEAPAAPDPVEMEVAEAADPQNSTIVEATPTVDAVTEARPAVDPVTHARAAVGAAQRSAALELEDVTYLGGFPGQTKRRKRCIATLTLEGFDLTGPADLAVHVGWDSVKSIETQNSDEARFRTNTKIHRDSSALVIDCEDGTTLMLEARDCPTVPLRAAISQLLGGLPVEVV